MNPLAWNFEIPQRMRMQPQIALGVLPIGLMFASFAPLFFLAMSLSSILGIPDNAPVSNQPNGLLWLILVLIAMVILMISGYLIGWVLNAIGLRVFFRWSEEKVNRVLLHSEVPLSWLKATNTATRAVSSTKVKNTTWAVTRQKGKWHFILQRGVLAWGLPMYLFVAVLPAITGRIESTPIYFLWQACLWGSGGALFGLVIWYFSERSSLKQHGEHET